MPEKLLYYLEIIRLHRQSFDKDFDYSILHSSTLSQIIKINTSSISFYRKMIEIINNTDIEKSATIEIVETLFDLISKKKDQNTLLKKIIIQRTQYGEPSLVLSPTMPIISFQEGMSLDDEYNKDTIIDETNNDFAYVTVFSKNDSSIYEVEKSLLPVFLKKLNTPSKTDDPKTPINKDTNLLFNYQGNIENKTNQIEDLLELFMISPVAYDVFSQYYRIIRKYFIDKKNTNITNKVSILDEFFNTLVLYLQDDSTAFSLFNAFINHLIATKIAKKSLLETPEIQSLILQNQISGQIWEQLKKPEILKLAKDNHLITQNTEVICAFY